MAVHSKKQHAVRAVVWSVFHFSKCSHLFFNLKIFDTRQVLTRYHGLKVLEKIKLGCALCRARPPSASVTEIRNPLAPASGILISVMPCSWGTTLHIKTCAQKCNLCACTLIQCNNSCCIRSHFKKQNARQGGCFFFHNANTTFLVFSLDT